MEEDAATRTDGAPSKEVHTLEHIGALDAVGARAELVEVVPVTAGRDMDDSVANRFIEIPEGGPDQEVPTIDRIQGSQPPTPDDGETNELLAGDEALASVAQDKQYPRSEENLAVKLLNDARHSEVLTTEHDQDASPKDELTIELPNIPRYREVLMAEHVEGYEASLARQGNDQPTDMLGGVLATEHDRDADPKDGLTTEIPNDPRYQEVLMAWHIEGFEAALARQDSGPPRETLGGLVAATERGQEPDPED